MSETLKPCPFCGSLEVVIDQDVCGNMLWNAQCMACEAASCVCDSIDLAIAAWNRRAESAAGADTHKLIANLFELALEWKSRDCAFRDPDARYCELEKQAKALGYLDGSRL